MFFFDSIFLYLEEVGVVFFGVFSCDVRIGKFFFFVYSGEVNIEFEGEVRVKEEFMGIKIDNDIGYVFSRGSLLMDLDFECIE